MSVYYFLKKGAKCMKYLSQIGFCKIAWFHLWVL